MSLPRSCRPRRRSCIPGCRDIAIRLAGGVARELAWAICQRASEAKKVNEPLRNFLMSAVGLAAVGTVADVVPLVDENRILVRHGLNSLKHVPPLGLALLMQVAKLHEKPSL